MKSYQIAIVVALLTGSFVSSIFYFGNNNPFVPFTVTQTDTVTATLTRMQTITSNLTNTRATTVTVVTTSTTFLSGTGQTEICFTPKGGCADKLITLIDQSKQSIHILMYTFTNSEITKALIRAKSKAVDIKVVLDEQQSTVQGSQFTALKTAGISVKIDKRGGLMHNKVAIIDQTTVISGSYNWSDAAENTNRENMIIMRNSNLASTYESNFQSIWNAIST